MLVGKEGSQDSPWDREQWGRTGGTVPPQSAFGICLHLPVPTPGRIIWNHSWLSGRQSLFQRLPKEHLVSCHLIPSHGLEFLPVAQTSSSPGSRARCVPNALSLVLGRFCDFGNDSHPHTGCLSCVCRAQGCWNGVIGLPGGILLEPGM